MSCPGNWELSPLYFTPGGHSTTKSQPSLLPAHCHLLRKAGHQHLPHAATLSSSTPDRMVFLRGKSDLSTPGLKAMHTFPKPAGRSQNTQMSYKVLCDLAACQESPPPTLFFRHTHLLLAPSRFACPSLHLNTLSLPLYLAN